jgi:hypothetical protein
MTLLIESWDSTMVDHIQQIGNCGLIRVGAKSKGLVIYPNSDLTNGCDSYNPKVFKRNL